MKITAELVFTVGTADAIRKGHIPSSEEMDAYAKKVIRAMLEELKGPVSHDNEDWVRIRVTSARIVE